MFDPLTQNLRGIHSIEASAGTGKTYSITLLWLRLLIEENLAVEQVLVSTFTRAATAELRERLLASLRVAASAAEAAVRGETFPEGPEGEIVRTFVGTGRETAGALLKRLSTALSSFDLAPISTLHGFCQTLIRRHALELGCDPGLRLVESQDRFVQNLVMDTVLHFSDEPRPKLEKLPELLRKVGGELTRWPGAKIALDAETPTADLARRIREELPRRKAQAGVRTFDDILVTVREALEKQGAEGALARAVRERLRAVIIDECQDSDTTQIRVFEMLFDHLETRSFLVIGDPKQSIYRFRGADLASYKRLASRAVAAPQMTVNHRSDSPLIEALNYLYGADYVFPDGLQAGRPTQYVRVTARHTGRRLTDPDLEAAVVVHRTAKTERNAAKNALAQWTAQECERLLRGGTRVVDRHTKQERCLEPGDIAVLAAAKSDLRIVRRALAGRGIPCQMDGKGLGSIFGSDEALDVFAWLDLLASFSEAGDTLRKLATLLATPLGAEPCENIPAMRENPMEIARLCERYRYSAALLQRAGPLPALMHHLSQDGLATRNAQHAEGERRITNWRHLAGLLQTRFSQGLRTAAALAEWLSLQVGAEQPLADEEEDGQGSLMKLETDDSALQLLTIHASKGLEFPVVFCPYLWHVGSVQHAKTQMKVAVLRQADDWFVDAQDPVSDTSKKEALEQQKEEEFRKLYVALTRARHRLYVGLASVASGGPQHANGSELSCLMQLPGLRSLLSEEGARLFSHSVVLPHDAPLSPPNAAEAADEHSSTAELGPPPVLRHGEASRHPVFTKRSFSSLARFGPHGDQHFHAPDHDTETELRPVAGSGEEDVLSQLGPAGSELGDRMHRALENHLGNHLSVRESVAAFPEAEAWEHALSTMVQAELRLGGEVLTLGGVRESCITEMQFHMPTELFSPMTLSRALLGDPLIAGDAARAEWASHLGSWPFSEFAGFLQGYIDLIFEHGGRWYVMDYKSNRLRGYEGGVVEAAMLQHHYLLQSRIYCIALDRHLRHHVRDYRPEEHFGGVAYVFVRGLPGGGVWFERPGLEALTALSELFSPAQA